MTMNSTHFTRTIRFTPHWFSHRVEVVVSPNERGVLVESASPARLIEPGRHKIRSTHGDAYVGVLNLDDHVLPYSPELAPMLPSELAEELTLKPNQVAVVTVDGQPHTMLRPGRYLLWQARHDVKAWVFDTDVLLASIPEDFVYLVPQDVLSQYTIAETQRGLVYVNGEIKQWLDPGRHFVWSRNRSLRVVMVDVTDPVFSATHEVRKVMPQGSAHKVVVGPNQLAVVHVDEVPTCCLNPGAYLLWQVRQDVGHDVYDMTDVHTSIPEYVWPMVDRRMLQVVTVHPYERGLLYVDGALQEVLEAGRYGFNVAHHDVKVHVVDMREKELHITGQDIMTADKVTIRVNLIATYRVKDALASVEEQTDLEGAIYSEVQIAARRAVSSTPIDRLLEERDRARDVMMERLASRAEAWGVEILQVDLKDLILPGEMKSLLNKVIEAEKQAQANVILRREETAANRAQANAAKMMESNPALMRMKELEVIERAARHIDSLNVVVGAQDVLEQFNLNR